ncbi:MAG: hypothetical protein JO287_11645 [Pseudonocardiales bacterium]|nr:hypothetical protein [Pseudonocardiales bacterium]
MAVRTPGEKAGKRRQQVRKYNTFHQTLTEMVSWLASEGHLGVIRLHFYDRLYAVPVLLG